MARQFDLHSDYRTGWFPKEYLTAADFDDGKGGYKSYTLSIRDITTRPLQDNKTKSKVPKPVIYFQGASKFLIMNRTIAEQLATICDSPYPADWIGKTVELFVERSVKTPQGPKDMPRIRKSKKNASLSEPPAEFEVPETEPLDDEAEYDAVDEFLDHHAEHDEEQ